MMDNQKVWFITGASKGLGLSLVKQLLQAGHPVAATSRNVEELVQAAGGPADKLLALQVNLADEQSVGAAIEKAHAHFGRIDVVVNNAGYGIGGSLEELTDEEIRQSFDVNVFGVINVIRKVMPYLRAQGAGHIINIASIAGITAVTGWAAYAATKAAVIALSEVLADDVRAFGVHVTVVSPGAFRTSFLSAGSLTLTKNPIEAYREVRASHERFLQMDGLQAGDPEKAAAAMIRITNEAQPPRHLLLGSDAYQRAFAKAQQREEEFRAWEALTQSTGY
jgi:NAD(P)-dependent dehydrogenase (short-subunit alcohol dehydrogenase family)